MRLSQLFAAMSSRNYRLFFGGQIVSLIGTWMTQTATLWLVHGLNPSAFILCVVGFASTMPIFFLAPFAGVLADRVNRHKLLLCTQVLSMLQSFALAALTLTGTINISLIIVLSLIQGLINAVDMPVRQTLVVEFVERREHLGNAIALNSSLFNLARLIGPALAGFIIAGFGTGYCFLVDGLTYVAVIVALLMMRLAKRPARTIKHHPLVEMKQGFHYAFKHPPIRALILLVAAIGTIGFSYMALMSIYAREVFQGDARTLGYLMSASAVGSLGAALYLGTRTTVRGLGNVISFGGVAMGVGLIGFALSRWLSLSFACLTLAGLGGVLLMASSNTLVQTLVDDDKRGRVMSIFSMGFTGTMPVGNLAVGYLADKFGTTRTLAACGAICIVIAGFFFRAVPKLRASAAPVLAKLDPTVFEPTVPEG